jgi:hypothetical protein
MNESSWWEGDRLSGLIAKRRLYPTWYHTTQGAYLHDPLAEQIDESAAAHHNLLLPDFPTFSAEGVPPRVLWDQTDRYAYMPYTNRTGNFVLISPRCLIVYH